MGNFWVRKNNVISMVRGDTFDFDVLIDDYLSEERRYILNNEDVIYFGLMDPNQPFEHALVKKRYTKENLDQAGNLIIVLDPEDTEDLVPGVYYYSIKIHRVNKELGIDSVNTIIPNTKFIIVD